MTTPSRAALREALRRGLLIAAMSASVLGCRAERIAGPIGNLTATYVLRSVDGVVLPTPLNGDAMTDFTVVADTVRLYDSGQGTESITTQRAGVGVQRSQSRFRYSINPKGDFSVEYICADGGSNALASCIAPPHHEGGVHASGMVWTNSQMYRTPLVFELISGGTVYRNAPSH